MDPTGLHHDGAGSGSSRNKTSSPTPSHRRNERWRIVNDNDESADTDSSTIVNKTFDSTVDSNTLNSSQITKTDSGNSSGKSFSSKSSINIAKPVEIKPTQAPVKQPTGISSNKTSPPKPAIVVPPAMIFDVTQSLSEG